MNHRHKALGFLGHCNKKRVVKDIECRKGYIDKDWQKFKGMTKVSYYSSRPFLCKAWGSEPLRLFPLKFLLKKTTMI